MSELLPLAVSITEAARMIGIGRTSLYAAIAAGRLKTRKSGRRTIVEVQVIREFVQTLPESGSQSET